MIYIDWENDVVAVIRWIRGGDALNNVVGTILASIEAPRARPRGNADHLAFTSCVYRLPLVTGSVRTMNPAQDSKSFEFERLLPIPMRLFLGAAGLFCILMPALDLGQAVLQLGWWTPFFGVIIVGAWAVGAIFLAAAIVGESPALAVPQWRARPLPQDLVVAHD